MAIQFDCLIDGGLVVPKAYVAFKQMVIRKVKITDKADEKGKFFFKSEAVVYLDAAHADINKNIPSMADLQEFRVEFDPDTDTVASMYGKLKDFIVLNTNFPNITSLDDFTDV